MKSRRVEKPAMRVNPSTTYAMTHEAIGEAMGIGATGAQQLEKRALDKCRDICARRGMTLPELINQLQIGVHDGRVE